MWLSFFPQSIGGKQFTIGRCKLPCTVLFRRTVKPLLSPVQEVSITCDK